MASQSGFYASNNGLSIKWHDASENYQPVSGEIYMGVEEPTSTQLTAAFSGYAAAVAARDAANSAQAKYASILSAGVVITSASTPALNGTYSISDTAQSNIQANQTSILTNGKFTNGQTTRAWLDMAGAAHTFTSVATFTAFAEAIGTYVDALIMELGVAQSGGTPTWPSNAITIP